MTEIDNRNQDEMLRYYEDRIKALKDKITELEDINFNLMMYVDSLRYE
jgi:hypothetical protein